MALTEGDPQGLLHQPGAAVTRDCTGKKRRPWLKFEGVHKKGKTPEILVKDEIISSTKKCIHQSNAIIELESNSRRMTT